MTLHLDAARRRAQRAPHSPPQRILMTVDSVGGVWRYALDLAQSLRDRGVRVALLGMGPEPSPAQIAEASAARLPLTWDPLPLDWMPGGMARLADARRAIVRAADSFKADLVHVNTIAFAGAELAARPVVAVTHSCTITWWRAVRGGDLPPQWQAHLHANRRGFDAAPMVVAPSRSHAAAVRAAYGLHSDLRVVFNASAGVAPTRRRREPFVFAAGRWWDEAKNARILDAAASLTKRPVIMAGSLQDPAGPRCELSHARALGSLDGAATGEWMRRASVFAAPSLYEPFGLAILEAARASTPLVLSDIPTFRELWDGAALFADPTSPEAFAQSIDLLMEDEPLRRKLAARARALAARLTLGRQAEAMLDVYRDVMGGALEMDPNARVGSAV